MALPRGLQWAWLPGSAPVCWPAAAAQQQHGVLDDARAAQGALLEDVVVLQPKPTGRSVGRPAREVHPRVGQSQLRARGGVRGGSFDPGEPFNREAVREF